MDSWVRRVTSSEPVGEQQPPRYAGRAILICTFVKTKYSAPSRVVPLVMQGFGYTEGLWIFLSESHGIEEIFNLFFFSIFFFILSDIEESTIKLSDFYLFRVQR